MNIQYPLYPSLYNDNQCIGDWSSRESGTQLLGPKPWRSPSFLLLCVLLRSLTMVLFIWCSFTLSYHMLCCMLSWVWSCYIACIVWCSADNYTLLIPQLWPPHVASTYPPPQWSPAGWLWPPAGPLSPGGCSFSCRSCWPRWTAPRRCPLHVDLDSQKHNMH